MDKFLRLTRDLREQQEGAVAVIVALLLTVLLGSTAVSVGYGAVQSARISTNSSAESLALEAARLCQINETDCTPAILTAKLTPLASASGVAIMTISIRVDDPSDPDNRSRLQVVVERDWQIPLLEIIRDSNAINVQSSASAAWTNQASVEEFEKGAYLPLMVSECAASKLRVPSTVELQLFDNGECEGGSAPEVWFFGNAGASDGSCWANNQGRTLSVGDTIQNPSAVAPTTKECLLNADYWVPVFDLYQSTKSVQVTLYTRTWFETLTYKRGKDTETVGPRSHVKTCTSQTSAITDSACVYVSSSPSPSDDLICPKNAKCEGPFFTEDKSLMESTTSTQVESVAPFGTVSRFMKIHLISVIFQNKQVNNKAVPNHIFVSKYAGQDIRLVVN